jgi:hypothetical protein
MNQRKAFDPQISPIDADGAGCGLAVWLFYPRNLRHLRIGLRFIE